MPASEAQVAANRRNAALSTGPKTVEGKEASRANAYKHGLTATKVFPEREAAEVQRRYGVYLAEFQPSGEVGSALVLRAAVLSARMERCVEYETAMLTERVRRAQADCEVPEGSDAAEEHRLRSEAGRRALFDPSKEAALSRKYEADAERNFLRCLKELRQHERALDAAEEDRIDEGLASIIPGAMTDEEFDEMEAEQARRGPRGPVPSADLADLLAARGRVDLPITVGRRR